VGQEKIVSVYAGGLQHTSVVQTTGTATSAPPTTLNVAPRLQLFSYSAPVITDLKPINGPTTGAYVVTISGRNFGNHWNQRMAFDGRVRFNMSFCSPQQWISDSSLRCAGTV